MAKYILVSPSSAKEGQDAAYNDWYENTHMPDVCALPGVTSARRFEIAPCSPNPAPGRYLAMYEIETDDPESVLAELYRRSRAGEMSSSPDIDLSSAQMWIFQQR